MGLEITPQLLKGFYQPKIPGFVYRCYEPTLHHPAYVPVFNKKRYCLDFRGHCNIIANNKKMENEVEIIFFIILAKSNWLKRTSSDHCL